MTPSENEKAASEKKTSDKHATSGKGSNRGGKEKAGATSRSRRPRQKSDKPAVPSAKPNAVPSMQKPGGNGGQGAQDARGSSRVRT